MKINNKECQQGRSILEMLFTLMIIGLLTAFGLLTFPKLLEKYKQQKIFDTISILANDIRSAYMKEAGYANLDNSAVLSLNLLPENMIDTNKKTITHAGKNNIIIKLVDGLPPYIKAGSVFEITVENLNRSECVFFASRDYKSSISEIYYIGIGTDTKFELFDQSNVPLNVSKIDELCVCTTSIDLDICKFSMALY